MRNMQRIRRVKYIARVLRVTLVVIALQKVSKDVLPVRDRLRSAEDQLAGDSNPGRTVSDTKYASTATTELDRFRAAVDDKAERKERRPPTSA